MLISLDKIQILLLLTLAITFSISEAASQNKQGFVTKWLVNDLCIAEEPPTQYAFWTVISNTNSLDQYLQKYATMQCNSFSSIYLLVNHQIDTSKYELNKQQKKWKKDIFFIYPQHQSVDNKFLIPSWVPQNVFINLEQTVSLNCSDLLSMFNQWLEKSIGNFGPIGSYFPQNIIYDYAKDNLEYYYPQKPLSAFNIVSMEISIIPKHLMNLYYADIFEFKQMRKIVEKQQNCEDIAFNFMVGLIYDQIPSFIFNHYQNATQLSEKYQQNKNASTLKKKTECVYKFFDICGKIPGKYLFTSDQTDIYEFKDFRERPLETLRCYALTKRVLIQKKYFSLESYYRQISAIEYIGNEKKLSEKVKEQNKILSLSQTKKQQMLTDKKDLFKYNLTYTFSDLIGLNSKQVQNYMKTFKQINQTEFQHKLAKLQKIKAQIKNVSYVIRKNKNHTSSQQLTLANQSYKQNAIVVLCLSVLLSILVFVAWKIPKKE